MWVCVCRTVNLDLAETQSGSTPDIHSQSLRYAVSRCMGSVFITDIFVLITLARIRLGSLLLFSLTTVS